VVIDRISSSSFILSSRLRQVDVKAEHFERQVQRVEQERDTWETKYEVCLTWSLLLLYVIPHVVSLAIRRTSGKNFTRRKQNWKSWRQPCRTCDCIFQDYADPHNILHIPIHAHHAPPLCPNCFGHLTFYDISSIQAA